MNKNPKGHPQTLNRGNPGKRSPLATFKIAHNAVKTYPVPEGVELSNEPNVYRPDLFANWVRSRTTKELQEVIELQNLVKLMKGDENQRVFKKLQLNQKLTSEDMGYINFVKETLIDIHKLKYGEKRVNLNTSLKDLRDSLWEEQNANPSSK